MKNNQIPKGAQKVTNKIIEISILIIFIAIFVLSIMYQENIKSLISKEILIYGIITIFLLSFLLDFIPQYITPHLLIIQSKILELPSMLTFSLIILGAILGSVVGFEIGKKYGRKIIKKIYSKKGYNLLQKRVKKYGKWVIALAAVSPIPYIPIIFGSLGVKKKTFSIYGLIPRIIGLVLFALFVSFF